MKTSAATASMIRMANRFDRFVHAFYGRLGRSSTWEAFLFIAHQLSEKSLISIFETGVQGSQYFSTDMSTMIWSWIGTNWDAEVFSVDERIQKVRDAKPHCPGVRIELQDPEEYLKQANLTECDLLFLNSKDCDDAEKAKVKVLQELAIAWGQLPTGCLIAIPTLNARHEHAEAFLRGGAVQRLEGSIAVWEKN